VLFSVWDTRVQDYAEYARAKGITPEKPNFDQGPTHPVVMVSWEDAKSFCRWLTATERAAGRIGGQEEYRLPSDHEWSCAVGVGRREKAEASPDEKAEKIEKVYPWGTQWPPPKGSGNYNYTLQVEGFQFTSPVGSFAANENGLYDMGGNVWQWCEDWYDVRRELRVLRGASWNCPIESTLRSTSRGYFGPTYRGDGQGFRCVVSLGDDSNNAAKVDPRIVGIWETKGVYHGVSWTLRWNQQSNGHFVHSKSDSDTGMATAIDGKLRIYSDTSKEWTDDTYEFLNATTLVTDGPVGKATWKRVETHTTSTRKR
jgi:hypothetical protein